MKKEFKYVLPKLTASQYPCIKKGKGAFVKIEVDKKRKSINFKCNTQGYLFLAKHFLAIGMMKDKVEGFHHHLEPVCVCEGEIWGDLDESHYEIELRNIDHA